MDPSDDLQSLAPRRVVRTMILYVTFDLHPMNLDKLEGFVALIRAVTTAELISCDGSIEILPTFKHITPARRDRPQASNAALVKRPTNPDQPVRLCQ